MAAVVRWHGDRVSRDVRKAAEPAIRRAAEFGLEQSNRTIPHFTGHMMRTGRVTMLSAIEAAISYDTKYAVRQHEDTRLRHAPGRRAKWLEKTLNEEAGRIRKWVADEIGKALS